MATDFSAPEGFEPPVLDMDDFRTGAWQAKEDAYIQRLADRAKMNGTNPLLGEVVRWQRADGYAQYMVWQTRPLQLIHLELGDAYSIEEPLMRGLRLADIRLMVERAANMRALFSKDKVVEDDFEYRPSGPRGCGDCGAPANSYHAGNCEVGR